MADANKENLSNVVIQQAELEIENHKATDNVDIKSSITVLVQSADGDVKSAGGNDVLIEPCTSESQQKDDGPVELIDGSVAQKENHVSCTLTNSMAQTISRSVAVSEADMSTASNKNMLVTSLKSAAVLSNQLSPIMPDKNLRCNADDRWSAFDRGVSSAQGDAARLTSGHLSSCTTPAKKQPCLHASLLSIVHNSTASNTLPVSAHPNYTCHMPTTSLIERIAGHTPVQMGEQHNLKPLSVDVKRCLSDRQHPANVNQKQEIGKLCNASVSKIPVKSTAGRSKYATLGQFPK